MMVNGNRLYEMRYLIKLTIGHKHFNGDATSIFEAVSFWLVVGLSEGNCLPGKLFNLIFGTL